MTNGSERERLDRIERILDQTAQSQEQTAKNLARVTEDLGQVTKSLQEMAARQQYHDEAFERHDAEMKLIRESIAADAENIRALVRLEHLEGGEAT
jgi:uncharacterized protein (DUF3084 family)